jgi:diguanylate cyclase (GGDEF)-like protein
MIIDDSQLARLLLFQSVNPESIRPWIDRCPLREFPAGAVLLTINEPTDCLYILLKGRVSIRLGAVDANPIAHAEEGECIGELSAFDGNPPSAFVKAETNVTTLVISHEILLDLVDRSHGVARNLLYLLSSRLRSGNHAVTNSLNLQKEFEQHANVDVLTGLYNRRWINDYFQRFMARIHYHDALPDLSVLLVDVDYFKAFNDRFGHLAGDQALRCVADALKVSVRPTDMVARYGGEEFLVILPETIEEDALLVAERMREGVKRSAIEMSNTIYPRVTISVGVAHLIPGDDFASLIKAADVALYQAKENGRDQVMKIR